MHNVTTDSITDAVLNHCTDTESDRLRFIFERLVHHLHDFARETDLTHEEWRTGIDFLTRTGEITTPNRNEFILLSDVLGLSSLVDMINSGPDATPSSALGPFHIMGAPDLAIGGDLKKDNPGDYVVVSGTVRDAEQKPVGGAVLEIWQTAPNGLYSNQDPEQSAFNLRARLKTGADGHYAFTTVRPCAYTVPDDGPVGEILHATGRHPWRPAHYHFIVFAPDHRTLVTELFPSDDAYIDDDAVFGVRRALTVPFKRHDDLADLPGGLEAADRITAPWYWVDFDFVLPRGQGGSAAPDGLSAQ